MKIKLLAIAVMIAAPVCPSAMAAPAAEPAVKMSFDLLKKTIVKNEGGDAEDGQNRQMTYPDALLKLEGKRVIISGFVAPYDDPEKMKKLTGVRLRVGQIFSNICE